MLARLQSFFRFGNSSPPQPRSESIDAVVVSRHSPTEIATLRCSDFIFFDTSAESARERLESRLKKKRAKEIGVIRLLPDAEVAGCYDELLPLLCIDFATHNNPNQKSTDRIRERGVIVYTAIAGKVYEVKLLPARKHPGSRTSVDQQCMESDSTTSDSVVYSWTVKLHSNTYKEHRQWSAEEQECNEYHNAVRVLRHGSFVSLKDLASFAVVHQAAGNVDGLRGLIPSRVIAYLKGR